MEGFGSAILIIESAIPIIGSTIPIIGSAMPIIGSAMPIIESAILIIGSAMPIIESAMPIIGSAIGGYLNSKWAFLISGVCLDLYWRVFEVLLWGFELNVGGVLWVLVLSN